MIFSTWGLTLYNPKTSFVYQHLARFAWTYDAITKKSQDDNSNPIFKYYHILSQTVKVYESIPFRQKNLIQMYALDVYGAGINVLQQNALANTQYRCIRLQNGTVSVAVDYCDMKKDAQNIIQFKDYLQKKNIPLLYVIAPHKNYKYQSLEPIGIKDYGNANGDSLRTLLQNKVDCIDIRDRFQLNPDKHYQYFYRGDSHWKIGYVYEAFVMVMNQLEHKYHFVFDERLKSISNFTQYESSSKATDLSSQYGRFLIPQEKFLYLKPKFPTHLSIHSHNSIQYRKYDIDYEGEFNMKKLYEDYPNLSIDNCDTLNEKRVLIIGDSFSPPLMNLLSLAFNHIEFHSHLHYEGNLYETVEKYNPDFVICVFTARQSKMSIFDKDRGNDVDVN